MRNFSIFQRNLKNERSETKTRRVKRYLYIFIHSYTCETSKDLGEQKRKKLWSSMTLKFVVFFSILVQHANINAFY